MSTFDRLRTELGEGRLAPVYLFYGKEDFLLGRAVTLLEKKLLRPGGDPFNLDVLDGAQCGVAQILACVGTPPVGAPWRLVVVRDAPFFAAREDAEKGSDADRLTAYVKKPLPQVCLVFVAGEGVDRRRALFKACSATGLVLEFVPLDARELGRWITDRLKREGFSISRGAAETLAARSGRSLRLVDQELKKAVLYAWEEKRIDEAVVNAVGSGWVEENIFAVVDAIGEKKWARAMAGIDDLLAARQPPPVILTMVARQLRMILQAGQYRRNGSTSGEFAADYKLHPYVARKVWDQTGRFAAGQAQAALVALAELDADVKTGNREFSPGFGDFLLSLAQSGGPPAGRS